jgi:hypothetical protein|nr:hypothetical protein [uncultured Mogibacterium sp.]DAP35146.1 MAG TPA: hypothetical protein [Caudoviricetes sp.]DAR66304.1 MAG TPA: hypothetical protein [Caudoviricetes sp.]DAR97546.1 MAG TPA: hypothetical protein [Caudoviricetes sp.]DAX72446.1 MAG TPA: hypothetical protein [Caudoviricetes sp.]
MNIGSVVDFCITYNNTMNSEAEEDTHEPRVRRRKATQADWDAFYGG